MGELTFFTDITTDISNYCLLNIKRYADPRKLFKRQIFIDPGVYELTERNEYSEIKKLHDLASWQLQPNEYISIDYPADMLPEGDVRWCFEDQFIEQSYQNNVKYAANPQYICTLQFQFENIKSFIESYNRHAPIFVNKDKILGIGNLCRIMYPNQFTDEVFEFLYQHQTEIKQIHFYGLSLRLIKKYLPRFTIPISVDSTKWTRAVTNEFKLSHGLCAKKHNRDLYFLEYMKELQPYFTKINY